MASLRVLPFDPEGRPVPFDTWHNDPQLYLLSDSRDSVSLFDHVSSAPPAPPATADVSTHLPATECAHFGEHRTAQALYDAVVARYSSPATAAIGRLLLPYLLPELSAFATVADPVTHLRSSDARYRAAIPAEFLPTNQPPMFITIYFIVTRLPDSLRFVRDHFLTLDPTSLTGDLLEQHLIAAETSAVAVGAARGTLRSPFFEGCSPSPLSSSFASAAAVDVSVREDVGAASTSTKRRNNKGKGSRSSGGGSGGGGGGSGSACNPSLGSIGDHQWTSDTPPHWDARSAHTGIRTRDRSDTMSESQPLDHWDKRASAASLGASASGTPPAPLTPFPAPDPVRLTDPSGGLVVANSSAVLPCPAVPSSSLLGLHLPSFSTNLASIAALQDTMVTTTTPGGQCVSICTCTRTERHLATFTRQLGSNLYTLANEPPQVAASAQVSASGQVAASCSCRLLSHQTLLWHHRLGHPSLPRLRGMHFRLLVSGLPRSLPPLPPSPAPPCLPCVKGRQRAAPHSSSFPPTTAPLQTLHMDVWGPARVSGQGRERYFLLVVENYTRYTTVFPLRSKGEVSAVLIPWIHAVRLQHREQFREDFRVLRLQSDRGGEFSSDLLRDFCRGEGILQSFTLPDSPQQNGIAEHRIGLVMEVARTSMIHAAAPHFLWLFAVRYAAHQLNLWPHVSLLETSPTLRWTGKVGDASVFQVWGSRAFVRDTSADKLSARAIPCVFVGFVPNAPGWQFYQPTSCRVLPSQDITFDESVPFYRLFPYHSAPSPPPPLFLAPGPAPVDPLPPQGPAPSGVSQVDPLPGTAPVQVAVVSEAAPGAASGGAASWGAEPSGAGSEGARSRGAEPKGVEPGGAESEGAKLGGAESEGAKSGGAQPRGDSSSGGPASASLRLSSQQLRAAVPTGAGDPTEPGAAGAGGAGAGVAGVGGPGAGGAGAAGAGVVDPGAGGAGGTVRPRPYFVPLLQQVLGVPSSTGLPPPFLYPPPDQLQPPLQPASPLPVPSPYTEQSGGLTERRMHTIALHPSSVPLRVPLPAPPESSLPEVPDPESDRARAASPTVARLLATAVTDPSFESGATSALVAELLDLTTACRLDYTSALVAESVPASPPSVGAVVPRFASLLLAPEGDPDAPDILTPRSYAEAITGPYSSQWLAAMDAEMASWKSTGTYVDEVPPPGVNIVDGMWIFRVKRPPGSRPAFKARYIAQGFTDPSLFLRTDTSLPPFYDLVYVDDLVFATADTEALTLVLQRFSFQYSSPQLTPLSTSHSLSAPPSNECRWRQRRRWRWNEKRSPLHSASSTSTASSSTPSASTSSSRVSNSSTSSSSASSASASSSRVSSSTASSSSASNSRASSSSASSSMVSSSSSSSSGAFSASASCSRVSNSSASRSRVSISSASNTTSSGSSNTSSTSTSRTSTSGTSSSSSNSSTSRTSSSSTFSSSASSSRASSSRVSSSRVSNTTSSGSSSSSSTSTSRISSSSTSRTFSSSSKSSTSMTSSSCTSSSSDSSGRASSSCSATPKACAPRKPLTHLLR
ncbi:unnamed protein product [Closterium sp. NIES-54]